MSCPQGKFCNKEIPEAYRRGFLFSMGIFPTSPEFTIFLWKHLFRLQVSPVLLASFALGPANGIQPKLQGCSSSLYFALYKAEKHCQMKK